MRMAPMAFINGKHPAPAHAGSRLALCRSQTSEKAAHKPPCRSTHREAELNPPRRPGPPHRYGVWRVLPALRRPDREQHSGACVFEQGNELAGPCTDLVIVSGRTPETHSRAVAIVLDLVNPALSGRWFRHERRDFRPDKAERAGPEGCMCRLCSCSA
jgi:hypothetical protein